MLTATALRNSIVNGEFTAESAVRSALGAIEARDASLNAFITVDADRALERARALDQRRDAPGPLHGVPVAIKDTICVRGVRATAGSRILGNWAPPYTATAVDRLEEAGAVVIGKTNCDEFAMGSSTEHSAFGPTRNPWDTSRIPGGSSGGSAAAVAADAAFGALGTDTGGSIRQPAALSGVVGMKPSYGRVSRFGLVAFASSLDQAGPLTKTVRDAALLMNAIAGPDPQDSTCLKEAIPDYTAGLDRDLHGVRLGLPKEYMIEGVDPQVKAAIERAVAHFESLGAEMVGVSLPHTEYAIASYYMIASAEASANLARFDGVRYVHRAENPSDLFDHYGRTREEGFGQEVKRRIILGTYVLRSGYYEAFYARAQKVRELIRQDFAHAFQMVDVILSPTSPVPAFPLGERSSDPLQMYLADIFTNAANLAGICGISLPCGFAQTGEGTKLPIGLQLLGKALDEGRILQVAHAYEQSTDWHKQRPPIRGET